MTVQLPKKSITTEIPFQQNKLIQFPHNNHKFLEKNSLTHKTKKHKQKNARLSEVVIKVVVFFLKQKWIVPQNQK